LAAISYLGAQIGKVLDELDRLGLGDNTVIVFWSDRGYHLGEKSLWAKTSNSELDARVSLIIRVPELRAAGQKTEALAELVDLYPMLVELCGLPAAKGLEGRSLAPVLKDPGTSVKDAAFTQHPRPAYYRGRPDVMGYSVRTVSHRYTEWRNWDTGRTIARELYAHQDDPAETRNIANMMKMKSFVAELSRRLPR
jgi:iduronate 2-sulfatase